MPASMMSEGIGGRVNVSGNSMPIATSGVMPGSTPISVPSATPAKQYARFSSENATAKPSARFSNKVEPGHELERQLEKDDKHAHGERRHHHGEKDHFAPAQVAAGERRDQEHRDQRGDEPEPGQHEPERDHGADDAADRPQLPMDRRLGLTPAQAARGEEHAEEREHHAERGREIARPHARERADRKVAV